MACRTTTAGCSAGSTRSSIRLLPAAVDPAKYVPRDRSLARPLAGPVPFARSRVEPLAFGQHGDEFLDAGRAGLGPLGVIDAVEDGVAVSAVEPAELLGRRWIGGQCRGEVVRD